MRVSGIYLLHFTDYNTSIFKIGKSINIARRMKQHINSLSKTHPNHKIDEIFLSQMETNNDLLLMIEHKIIYNISLSINARLKKEYFISDYSIIDTKIKDIFFESLIEMGYSVENWSKGGKLNYIYDNHGITTYPEGYIF